MWNYRKEIEKKISKEKDEDLVKLLRSSNNLVEIEKKRAKDSISKED